MSYVEKPKWFFGVIDQPGIWATCKGKPGGDISIGYYKCSQSMDPCWVAYLGNLPEIELPPKITTSQVMIRINQKIALPNPKTNLYESDALERQVISLLEAEAAAQKAVDNIRTLAGLKG
jgi:hypothetical protein